MLTNIHSLDTCLLSTFHMLDIIVALDTSVNKYLCLHGAYTLIKGDKH